MSFEMPSLEERIENLAQYYDGLAQMWKDRPQPSVPHHKVFSVMAENLRDTLEDHRKGEPLPEVPVVCPPKVNP